MKSLSQKIVRFLTREDGPTTVEYALMLGLIVLACFAAISTLGTRSSATFQNFSENMPDGS